MSNIMSNAPKIEDFQQIKLISTGAFGKVFLARRKNDKLGVNYAIKVMQKKDVVNKNMINHVIAERNAMAVSRSVFIVHLYYLIQNENNIFFVMEYMIGGDLKSLLLIHSNFSIEMTQFYTAEVVKALEYLHSKGIVHRDLKPDNMLISATGHLKLTDFGLSEVREYTKDLLICDVINTPMTNRNVQHSTFSRTPGQILSLLSHIAFDQSTPKKRLNQTIMNNSKCFVKSPNHGLWGSRYGESPILSGRNRSQKLDSFPPSTPKNSTSSCNTTPTRPNLINYSSFCGQSTLSSNLNMSLLSNSSNISDVFNDNSPEKLDMDDLCINMNDCHFNNNSESSDYNVMGTPDYLAPELLLGLSNNAIVDYWALGVCIYEFIYGFTPFTGNTVGIVFENIQNRNLQFPEDGDDYATVRDLIDQLLTVDVNKRANYNVVTKHEFFKTIDLDNVHQLTPPFIPNPDNDTDTSYFEPRNQLKSLTNISDK